MPCGVCNETGHSGKRCNLRRIRGIVIYHELKEVVMNDIHNQDFIGFDFKTIIRRQFTDLLVLDIDCLFEYLQEKGLVFEQYYLNDKTLKSNIITDYLVANMRRIQVEREYNDVLLQYNNTYIMRSYQQIASNRRQARRQTMVNRYGGIRNDTRGVTMRRPDRMNFVLEENKNVFVINVSINASIIVEEDDECPICIQKMNNENVVVTQCGHKTCVKCMEKYIKLLKPQKNPSCSLCRACIEEIQVTSETNQCCIESSMKREVKIEITINDFNEVIQLIRENNTHSLFTYIYSKIHNLGYECYDVIYDVYIGNIKSTIGGKGVTVFRSVFNQVVLRCILGLEPPF